MMLRVRPHSLREVVQAALDEDVGNGDLTSLGCLDPGPVQGEIIAKSSGILSGVDAALMAVGIVDSANQVTFEKNDGDPFQVGDRIASFQGFNQTMLASERVALNFLGHLSGIATLTHAFVSAVNGTRAKILDTRKTTPGLRALEKAAVRHGGGFNHRFGLYDAILIKDNHLASAGSVRGAMERMREYLASSDYRLQFEHPADQLFIEVEVESVEQLREAIDAGVDRVLLDNRNLDQLREMVSLARKMNPGVELEASGNVTLDRVRAIAETGVDYISVGAITHSVKVADFSMRVHAISYESTAE